MPNISVLNRRFSAFCMIFALLGLMLAGSGMQDRAEPSLHAQTVLAGAPRVAVLAMPRVPTEEELLRTHPDRGTHLRRQSGARSPFGFLPPGRYGVCTADMRFVLLPQMVCGQRGHCRFIIKYIHDQDGCKPAAFVFCRITTSNETEVQNYGSNCADRSLCRAVSRHDHHRPVFLR